MQEASSKKTALLFTGYIFDKSSVVKHLEKAQNTVAFFIDTATDPEIPGIKIAVQTDEQKAKTAAVFKEFDDVCIVTPALSWLNALAEGNCGTFATEIVMRALLWHKNVMLLLDFPVEKHGRNVAFQRLSQSLCILAEMGIGIAGMECSQKEECIGFKLITEHDIKEAAAQNLSEIALAPGGIVTPLARDTAKEKNIRILNIKE